MTQEKRIVVTGSFALTVGAYVSAAVTFIISVLLARYLTKELYGIYIFILSFASMCYLFTDFGIDGVTTYFVQRYKDRKIEIARYAVFSGLKIKILLSCLVLAVMVFLGFNDSRYWFTAVFFTLLVPSYYIRMFLTSFQHFRLSGLITIIESLLKLVFVYVVLTFITTTNLSAIIVAVALPMFISIIFGVRNIFKTVSIKNSTLRFNEIKGEAIFYWKWMFLLALILPINGNILQVILGMLDQMRMLAILGVGMTLSNSIRIIVTSVKSTIFPSFIKKTDKKDVSYALVDSIRYMFLIALFIGFLVHFVSEQMVITFYTPKYADASIIFEVLTYGIVFSLVFTGLRPTAISIRRPEFLVASDLINLVTMISLAYLIIPVYGALGAAIAITAGLVTGTCLLLITIYQETRFKFPVKTFLRCTIASILALFPLQIIKTGMLQSLVINVFVGGSIYLYLLYIMKEISQEDIELLKNLKKETMEYIYSIFRR